MKKSSIEIRKSRKKVENFWNLKLRVRNVKIFLLWNFNAQCLKIEMFHIKDNLSSIYTILLFVMSYLVYLIYLIVRYCQIQPLNFNFQSSVLIRQSREFYGFNKNNISQKMEIDNKNKETFLSSEIFNYSGFSLSEVDEYCTIHALYKALVRRNALHQLSLYAFIITIYLGEKFQGKILKPFLLQ